MYHCMENSQASVTYTVYNILILVQSVCAVKKHFSAQLQILKALWSLIRPQGLLPLPHKTVEDEAPSKLLLPPQSLQAFRLSL